MNRPLFGLLALLHALGGRDRRIRIVHARQTLEVVEVELGVVTQVFRHLDQMVWRDEKVVVQGGELRGFVAEHHVLAELRLQGFEDAFGIHPSFRMRRGGHLDATDTCLFAP